MNNPHIQARLTALLDVLMRSFVGGSEMSDATKGRERELFIEALLSQVFPFATRFGTGDITDAAAHRTGQVDIVVETPFLFSFPVHTNGPRLYLAEGVAATIEVKSDLAKQWDSVEATARRIKALRRRFDAEQHTLLADLIERRGAGEPDAERLARAFRSAAETFPGPPSPTIPVFAVGFHGWKAQDALLERIRPGTVDGIFVIEHQLCQVGGQLGTGPASLLTFLQELARHIHSAARLDTLVHAYSMPTLP